MAFDMFDEATAAGRQMMGADAAWVAERAFEMATRMAEFGETAAEARAAVEGK